MNPPYIPATALGGDLITGWSGPCEVLAHARFPVALPDAAHLAMLRGESAWVSCFLSLDACGGDTLPRRNVCLDRGQNFSFDPARCRMRLDPRRPEVAHRIADILRARGHEVGPLLPVALGGRQGDVVAEERLAMSNVPEVLLDVIRRTIPAADVSALLLAASVAGVEAGAGVARGVLGEWTNDHGYWVRTLPATRHIGIEGVTVNDSGWRVPTARVDPHLTSYGPETGPEGRAAADAALLRLGFAYLDTSAPFGVRVPFLNMEPR